MNNSCLGGLIQHVMQDLLTKRMILAHDCQGDITFFLRCILGRMCFRYALGKLKRRTIVLDIPPEIEDSLWVFP